MATESVYINGTWVDKSVAIADRLAALDRQVTALQRCKADSGARIKYLEGILADAGRRRDMFDPERLEANRVVHVEAMRLAAAQELIERTVPVEV